MRILLCNDDGVHADGLWALHERLSARHSVLVVAPDRERTAASHAITLHVPIRINPVSVNGRGKAFAVSGTPADCIKLALTELMQDRPDLVISGINPGANLGVDINYSGTFAAAKEAAFFGITALAVSLAKRKPRHYSQAAGFVSNFAELLMQKGLPGGTLLNINIPDLPAKQMRGVKVCKQYIRHLGEPLEKRKDPRDGVYYWYGKNSQIQEADSNLDAAAIQQNYISITPVKCDMTDYQLMDDLRSWNLRIE
ncbi:MAG: 5'/3'-nucleotidase SurE [Deltaproteobacteria bacterium]|jgi:5'-nucleotidase